MDTNLEKNFRTTIDIMNKRDVALDKGYFFNQNDRNTSTIIAEIKNNGKTMNLENCAVTLSVRKPNGDKSVNVCQVVDEKKGIVRLIFSRDMLRFAGLASFQVCLQYEEKTVYSNTFFFLINDAIVKDEDITDDDNYSILEQIQKQTWKVLQGDKEKLARIENLEIELKNAEEERIKIDKELSEREKIRIANEIVRQEQEGKRVYNYDRLKGILDNMEELSNKVANDENIRLDNEKNRVASENNRDIKEKERIANEDIRNSNEDIRIENENKRKKDENIRIDNENKRVEVENTRIDNENKRKSNETTRINNENRRNSDFTELNNSYNITKEKIQEISDTIDKQHKEIDKTHTEVLNSEKIRVSNEENRVKKEIERVSAENKRIEAYTFAKELIEKMEIRIDNDKMLNYINNELNKKADKDEILTKADKVEVDKIIQELSDEDINVVAEDKKLSEVLPIVAKKGEILPQDIKGNTLKSLIQHISMNENDNIAIEWINSEGLVKKYHIYLSEKYAKKTDLEALQKSNRETTEKLNLALKKIIEG